MRCMVCNQEIPEGRETCPRCGFVQYQVIGDAREANSALEAIAEKHRKSLLQRFTIGVTIFTWRDQDGLVVLDQKKQLSYSLGGNYLPGEKVWWEQQFARIPNEKELTIELLVSNGDSVRTIPVRIPVPQEKQLQTLGFQASGDLHVRLLLKNTLTQTCSEWVDLLQ